MAIKFNASRLHRRAAPLLCLPLLITSVTGLIYRIGKNKFGLSDDAGTWVLRLHDGRVLSDRLAPLYVLLMGVGLITLLVTGINLFIRRSRRPRPAARSLKMSCRTLHKSLSPILFLPLLISALSGIIYRIGKAWLGLEDKYVKVFLKIHEGSYLSPNLHLAYVSLVGIGLVALLVTGIPMLSLFQNARAVNPSVENNE